MTLSREAKLVSGVVLLVVPTILYGGVTLLGVVTQGAAGLPPGELSLDHSQRALWRAGHGHAGVWVLLSLVMQVLIDSTRMSSRSRWLARMSAPVAAVAVSAGFFGLAFLPGFRWLLYLGGLSLLVSVVLTGVGLLNNLSTHESGATKPRSTQ